MATLRQIKEVIDAFDDDEVVTAEQVSAFIASFGGEAKKPTIRTRAPEIAERLAALGCTTIGDVRSVSYEILEAECYMLKLDAVRLAGFFARTEAVSKP